MYNKNTIKPERGLINKQPEYQILCAMKQRCYYKSQENYFRYGGRGIKISERWRARGGFWNFIDDMGSRPSTMHTIERIDNNKDYTPDNCRWATYQEQARNRGVRTDNKVGISGVNYDIVNNRWVARKSTLDGRRICLGYFKNQQDAVGAVLTFIYSYGLL